MTTIDTTTSQGQLHLRTELERRKLRLQRDLDGYRIERWGIHSRTKLSASGTKVQSPIHRWTTVATVDNLAAVATSLEDTR
jgi:hypothetical protein